MSEKFNGVSLFSSDSSTSTEVYTSTQGSTGSKITINNLDIVAAVSSFAAASSSAAVTMKVPLRQAEISQSAVQLPILPVFRRKAGENSHL